MNCPENIELRDYFAAHALVNGISWAVHRNLNWNPRVVARHCYDMADAMLAVREEEPLKDGDTVPRDFNDWPIKVGG